MPHQNLMDDGELPADVVAKEFGGSSDGRWLLLGD